VEIKHKLKIRKQHKKAKKIKGDPCKDITVDFERESISVGNSSGTKNRAS